MSTPPNFAEVGALIGDPARANMLAALLDGRALTASELAFHARVTPQTASGHLARLTDGRLLAVSRQGRHRYYRLASREVGQMLESVMAVAAAGPARYRPPSRIDAALRRARTCYDHLAGQLGVALADGLRAQGLLHLDNDGGELTATGTRALSRFGIDLPSVSSLRRPFCRPCLDWSERRPHLAGALGAALASRCFDRGWIGRIRDSRAVTITAKGERGFREAFGVNLPE